MKQSHVVYDIPCCKDSYVGETRNRIETREDGHIYNIEVKNSNHSALCKHAIKEKHTPKWEQVKVLYRDRNHKSRQIKEMIGIKQTKNNLNKKTDTLFLSIIYNDILGFESPTIEINQNPTQTT